MIGVVSDPVFMEHDTGGYHPEEPMRVQYIHTLFSDPPEGVMLIDPVEASEDDIMLNHDKAYIEKVKNASASGRMVSLDPDTVCSPRSFDVALKASGSLNKLTEMALSGEISSGFASIRPPGHHATSTAAMGFCLFNNIAIAAKKALSLGAKNVLIVDFDVHHGNGTQESFYNDDRVLYFSSHQYPFYPGTGALSEVGGQRGKGFTVNCPMSYGKVDGEYIAVYRYILDPIIHIFKPSIVLVSAGFDPHAMDPIGGMRLSSECFGAIAGIIRDASADVGAPVVFTLEGGYDMDALRDSVQNVIEVMRGADPPSVNPLEWKELDNLVAMHRNYWDL